MITKDRREISKMANFRDKDIKSHVDQLENN